MAFEEYVSPTEQPIADDVWEELANAADANGPWRYHALVDKLPAYDKSNNGKVENPLAGDQAVRHLYWREWDTMGAIPPNAPVMAVAVAAVDISQPHLSRAALHAAVERLDDDPDGTAIEHSGRYFLLTGHERVVAKWLRDDVTVFLRVAPAKPPTDKDAKYLQLAEAVRVLADREPKVEVHVAPPEVHVAAPKPTARKFVVDRDVNGRMVGAHEEDA